MQQEFCNKTYHQQLGVPVVFFQKSFKDIIVVIYKSIKNNE